MKDSRVYLNHILDEIELIRSVCTDLSFDDFRASKEKEHTITRSLEIIGEAAKNVPEQVKKKHPEIPWKFMAGLRDKIIHGYFAINYDIVWDVITRKIPDLEPKIREICEEQEPDE
ncbi:MAG: hypothetical protein A4E35_01945 [Methanoregula sp. PtaU1.Bin051]|nr:MAG: hypothetical protein A4E35_01945 [Methanoregula sp. PtaU1.Bin051]